MASESRRDRRVRVLFVAPTIDILGGQAVQAARLMERLKDEQSLEIGFLPINPRLPGILRNLQSVTYVRTVVTSIAYILSLLIRVPKYDVLHVFSASYFSFVLAPTPAILIGKLFRRKVLLNYHSGEAKDHLERWGRSAIPTIKLADMVVVPSDYLVKVFAEFGLTATPIYNLIDTSKFRFRERVPLRPLFLSNRNLEIHYGVDRILRAFAIIQNRQPDARLTIAGDGGQRRPLEELARQLELKNVSFIGQVKPDSMPELYDAADVYLNGSEIDNQPLSLLEAFACGIPIVTTDAGGIPYIVEDRKTGMLVPCGDYAQMAERVLLLQQEPELTRRLIEAGRKECARYSWEAVRDPWLHVYHELADGAPLAVGQPVETNVHAPESKAITR